MFNLVIVRLGLLVYLEQAVAVTDNLVSSRDLDTEEGNSDSGEGNSDTREGNSDAGE